VEPIGKGIYRLEPNLSAVIPDSSDFQGLKEAVTVSAPVK
jgi:hypothetical protein